MNSRIERYIIDVQLSPGTNTVSPGLWVNSMIGTSFPYAAFMRGSMSTLQHKWLSVKDWLYGNTVDMNLKQRIALI